ncbi:MAG: hypothetical protein DRP47_09335 [Candidatus Zixiibacteriota bacterium]|nr:MAG: hypothetical protein DRP47_09335 [candidate division Zixibacteria bacterium]
MSAAKIAFVFAFTFAFVFSILMHEYVHQMIYARYGVDSKIVPIPFGWATVGNETQIAELDEKDFREMEILHLQNEIIAYNLQWFLAVLFISLFFLFSELNDLKEEVRKIAKKMEENRI